MIEVTGLYLYPIKSLQGLAITQAEVLERGFKHDRRWMIVNSDHQHVTQRTHPHLSQIKIQLSENSIIALHVGMEDLEIPLILEEGNSTTVTVWNDQVQVLIASDSINQWVSKIVGMPSKLVFMPEDAKRAINPEKARNGENVSFADGYPYLIISEESLQDLNSRMDMPLPMHRFRPNIVVKGGEPYEEDQWKDFRIGEVDFYGTHPCKRCVFTTVDQETGKKGVEPLKTLATYRREGKEVIFGVNVIAASAGIIRMGNEIVLK